MKSEKRTKKEVKDSQLIIRIKREDRDAFIEHCEALDTIAAREIRRFIREFVSSHTREPEIEPAPNRPEEEAESWPNNPKSKRSKKK